MAAWGVRVGQAPTSERNFPEPRKPVSRSTESLAGGRLFATAVWISGWV